MKATFFTVISEMKKKGFTLFEIILALIIFSFIIGIIFDIYINVKKSEQNIANQQLLASQTNDFLDYLNDLSLDYTLDYEEYFNRTMSNCTINPELFWNNVWECDIFTQYWNAGIWDIPYYCSSNWDGQQSGYNYYYIDSIWCAQDWPQYFYTYKWQFRNIRDSNLDNWDDIFLWEWPIAIVNNTWVQELYLISKSWDHRVFFRRKFIKWVDVNGDWNITGKSESLYTIQMLKLRWFDAWVNHDFDTWNIFTYNWFIDTRACDTDNWFNCIWSIVWNGEFSWYTLASDWNDGRVDITDQKITISNWDIEVYPAKDPYLSKNDTWYAVDPFIKISLTANMYGYQSNDEINLQTSIWFKNSYFNFEKIEYTGFLP